MITVSGPGSVQNTSVGARVCFTVSGIDAAPTVTVDLDGAKVTVVETTRTALGFEVCLALPPGSQGVLNATIIGPGGSIARATVAVVR